MNRRAFLSALAAAPLAAVAAHRATQANIVAIEAVLKDAFKGWGPFPGGGLLECENDGTVAATYGGFSREIIFAGRRGGKSGGMAKYLAIRNGEC